MKILSPGELITLKGIRFSRKARKSGAGFTTLESWLGDYDALFLKRNNADPMVCVAWRTWVALLAKMPR
jgi:hypothetical protein